MQRDENVRIFWGESHDNVYQFEPLPAPIDEVLRRAASHLDFYAAAYYTSCAEAFQPGGHPTEGEGAGKLVLEGWKPRERLEREWAELQEATRAADSPGEFVTFPGYEWQGDGTGGDHNVFYFTEGPPVFRVDTLAELYERLRGVEVGALAIPHHTAYRPGVRGRDWSVFCEELSPFTEVFSNHGCSETDEEWVGLRKNPHMGPGHGGGTWQDALDRGLHVGAVCSTDRWGFMPAEYGSGCMAVLAAELTRQALWNSMKARRVYGVTGDRIELDFRVGGAMMGDIVTADGPRRITVDVRGSDAIDRIELLRRGRVIATHCHQGTWAAPAPGRRSKFKIRLECGWGPRPNELRVPDREWEGELSVGGGQLVGWEPCWISPGQTAPELAGERAGIRMLSSSRDVGARRQNSIVFEFEAEPGSALSVRMNGLEEAGTVADFCRGSREMWFKDECVEMLHDLAGVEPGSPERDDIYHHVAFKTKVHRCVPEAGYTASLEHVDEKPIPAGGEVEYRVRVEQRNGQRAWSSPVWVRAEGAG